MNLQYMILFFVFKNETNAFIEYYNVIMKYLLQEL